MNIVEKWEQAKSGAAVVAFPQPSQPTPKSSQAADTAVALLKLIDLDGWHNLVALDPEKKERVVGRTFPPQSWAAIASFIDTWNGKRNLYFSVNEPFPGSPDDKLGKKDISRVRALFVDVDPEDDVAFERARFDLDQRAKVVQTAVMPPSLALDSGGGNQYFWLLAEKLDTADGGLHRAEAQCYALKHVYDGDGVQNIDRIMRLPGTINIPDAKKHGAGRVRRAAKMLFANDRRYSLEDFETGIAQIGPSGGVGQDADPLVNEALGIIDLDSARSVSSLGDLSADLRKRFEHASASSPRLRGLWAGDRSFLGEDTSGSGWRACFVQELARSVVSFSVQDYVELAHACSVIDAGKYDARQYARDWGKFAAQQAKEREGWFEPQPLNDNAEATDWPEPIDIFGDADPMEFGEPPTNSLPPILEQFARSEARRKGVSMAFAASAALGVTAAAIGASLRIQVRQHDTGWTEPASLWLALVAEPGRAKSPTISEATRPLRDLDTEHYRAFKVQHDLWNAAAQAHKKRGGAPVPGPEPIMRRIAVDDITFEMQARIHADNPRGLLRTPDELMGFFGSFGAYKQKSDGDRTQMLRLFDGGSIMMDRVGAGSIRAEHALMGIVAGTQPEKIQKITRDLGADGMLQRFLFIVDDGVDRRGLDEQPDARAANLYRSMLRSLASHDYPAGNVVRLSPGAYAVLSQAAHSIDALKGLVGMPAAWRGHVEKWGKLLPRIVLTFHCVDQFALVGVVDPTMPIDAMTVERAANFARFLLRHSLAFYRQNFDLDAATEEGRAFAGYLLTRPDVETVTHRTLYDARTNLRGQDKHRARVQILKDLESAGWLRIAEQGADGPARCNVNPRIHKRFVERANWERRDREAKRAAIQNAGAAKDWLSTDSMSGKSGAFR